MLWNWPQGSGTKSKNLLNHWDMVLDMAVENWWSKDSQDIQYAVSSLKTKSET